MERRSPLTPAPRALHRYHPHDTYGNGNSRDEAPITPALEENLPPAEAVLPILPARKHSKDFSAMGNGNSLPPAEAVLPILPARKQSKDCSSSMGQQERKALADLDRSCNTSSICGGRDLPPRQSTLQVLDDFGDASDRRIRTTIGATRMSRLSRRSRHSTSRSQPYTARAMMGQENEGSSATSVAPFAGMYRFGSFDDRALQEIAFHIDEEDCKEIEESDGELISDNLSQDLEKKIWTSGNHMYEFEIFRDPSPDRIE